MKLKLIALLIISMFISACAPQPAVRSEYTALPGLQKGMSRIFVSAGKTSGVRLWSVHQVGPVYINNRQVGSTAKDEYIAVDLRPGTYEVYCSPEKPEKNKIIKTSITITAGQKLNLVCDMEQEGAGGMFGLLGAIAAEYLTRTVLVEREMDNPQSRLVSYKRF